MLLLRHFLMRLTFKSVHLEWSRLPSICGWALCNQVRALREKDWSALRKKKFYLQKAVVLKLRHQLFPGWPSIRQTDRQTETYTHTHAHTFTQQYCFCYSGELWTIHHNSPDSYLHSVEFKVSCPGVQGGLWKQHFSAIREAAPAVYPLNSITCTSDWKLFVSVFTDKKPNS